MTNSIRKHLVFTTGELSATLTYYPAGLEQKNHAHDFHQLSFLLCGEFFEDSRTPRKGKEIFLPSIGVKPSGFTHANNYGLQGALIFSLNIYTQDLGDAALADWDWRVMSAKAQRRQILATIRMLVQGQMTDIAGGINDLIVLSASPDSFSPSKRRPPAWLAQVCDALREDDSISLQTLAKESGIHPVHLSRAFNHYLGCPASVYRANYRFARALRALLDNRKRIVDVASIAGFADQSHFTREAHRLTGLTPRQLHHLLKSLG